jgi:hypothetical protein
MPRPVLLAVDGDPAAKTAIERELRKRYEADCQVLCAGSGAAGMQALEQIGARGGEVALVLHETGSPLADIIQLTPRKRPRRPNAAGGASAATALGPHRARTEPPQGW